MNEIFMVDHICITCARIAELKIDLPHLDCLELDRFQPDYTHVFCLPQNLLLTYATDLYFTYICKQSCILNNGNNEHNNIIDCTTFWFYLATMKFDHRSSVRTLDLILNNQNLYIDVSP